MDSIYIFGHKNPDTDSVTSAISLSYLKNMKKINTIPCILGNVNNETKFVLDYFKVKEPIYLNDVKLQVRDLNYKKNCHLEDNKTLHELYNYMQNEEITGVPICDNKNNYTGIVTMKDLLHIIINPHYDELYTSYDNILNVIKGKEILRFKNEIKGKVIISAYKTSDFEEMINLTNNDIVIVGNRFNLIKYAIESKVELIVIVGTKEISDELLALAKRKRVNIIASMQESFYVSRMVILSNYIRNIISKQNTHAVDENMYVNDFLTIFNKFKFTNYPIINRDGKILGLLRSEDIHEKNKKKVILVDHNEYNQSVDGIDEANILEIVDHHKIGNVNSSEPINFRNMNVGSTNTIIYEMYREQRVSPPPKIAGLMLAGIISDTLLFHSPTSTIRDKNAANSLSKIAKVDIEKFSEKMFAEAASIKGKTIEELIYNDFKVFNIGKYKIGIGQMTIINYKEVLKDKNKYLKVIENISLEHGYDILAFCITDVINNNTYLLYNEDAKTIFEVVFGIENLYEGYELKGIVSRKKQIIPLLMEELG